jgi:hypothetical protein
MFTCRLTRRRDEQTRACRISIHPFGLEALGRSKAENIAVLAAQCRPSTKAKSALPFAREG